MYRALCAVVITLCLVGPFTAPAAATKPRMPLACRAVADLEELLAPGALLFFGEIHGTAEAPAFVANAACLALDAGRRILVGLEVPHEEDERVRRFLDSEGSVTDREALLASPFWQRSYQDGRGSQAMLALLNELRRFRRGGHSVSVTLFDSSERTASGQDRDRAMARRLGQAIEAAGEDVVLVLTGNVHSRVSQGTPWDESYEPMGLLIAGTLEGRSWLALNLSSTGGTAWTCNSGRAEDCGARKMGGRGEGEDWSVLVVDPATPGERGHHGRYHVGTLTASPPASESSAPRPVVPSSAIE